MRLLKKYLDGLVQIFVRLAELGVWLFRIGAKSRPENIPRSRFGRSTFDARPFQFD